LILQQTTGSYRDTSDNSLMLQPVICAWPCCVQIVAQFLWSSRYYPRAVYLKFMVDSVTLGQLFS